MRRCECLRTRVRVLLMSWFMGSSEHSPAPEGPEDAESAKDAVQIANDACAVFSETGDKKGQ